MSLTLSELIGIAISLLGVFTGIVTGLVKILLSQFEKRLNERFAEVEKDVERIARIERELLEFKADLPTHYVRREDYVRGQTVLEAKMDTLAAKIETLQIQGGRNA